MLSKQSQLGKTLYTIVSSIVVWVVLIEPFNHSASAQDPPKPFDQKTFQVRPTIGPQQSGTLEITDQNGLISIIARQAQLSEVLALLSEKYDLNFVHGEMQNTISISIRNVPIRDALTSLLSVAGYSWSRYNEIIHVIPITKEAKQNISPEMSGLTVRVFPLDFVSAKDVNQIVTGMLSGSGNSYVLEADVADNRKTTDSIVVEDFPGSIKRIEQYIMEVDVPPRQVVIEAKVLEVKLRDGQRQGVNFEQIFSISGHKLKLGTLGVDKSGTSTFFAEIETNHLKGLLDALQTTVDTKTLASPRIMAINGQEATLQVGKQLGFRVITTTQTSTLEDVKFLNVGIVLSITPRIARDGRIMLKVKPEVSSGQINPDTGLPEEETSEIETNVLLAHGKGMIIGGLIQEKTNESRSQVPRLGNLKALGHLFRHRETERERSEIIFVLMPRVVTYESNENSVYVENELLNQRDRIDVRRTNHILDPCLSKYPRPNDVDRIYHERQYTRGQTLLPKEELYSENLLESQPYANQQHTTQQHTTQPYTNQPQFPESYNSRSHTLPNRSNRQQQAPRSEVRQHHASCRCQACETTRLNQEYARAQFLREQQRAAAERRYATQNSASQLSRITTPPNYWSQFKPSTNPTQTTNQAYANQNNNRPDANQRDRQIRQASYQQQPSRMQRNSNAVPQNYQPTHHLPRTNPQSNAAKQQRRRTGK